MSLTKPNLWVATIFLCVSYLWFFVPIKFGTKFAGHYVGADIPTHNRQTLSTMATTTQTERMQAAYTALDEFINDFGADLNGLAKKMASAHPTLQQKYYSLCAKFIKQMAEKSYVDPRNQFANRMCKDLYAVLQEKGCGEDGTGAPCI